MAGKRNKRTKWGTGVATGVALGFTFGFLTGAYFFYIVCGIALGLVVDWNRQRK